MHPPEIWHCWPPPQLCRCWWRVGGCAASSWSRRSIPRSSQHSGSDCSHSTSPPVVLPPLSVGKIVIVSNETHHCHVVRIFNDVVWAGPCVRTVVGLEHILVGETEIEPEMVFHVLTDCRLWVRESISWWWGPWYLMNSVCWPTAGWLSWNLSQQHSNTSLSCRWARLRCRAEEMVSSVHPVWVKSRGQCGDYVVVNQPFRALHHYRCLCIVEKWAGRRWRCWLIYGQRNI